MSTYLFLQANNQQAELFQDAELGTHHSTQKSMAQALNDQIHGTGRAESPCQEHFL